MGGSTFWVFLKTGARRFVNRVNILVFLILLGLSLCLAQMNIRDYLGMRETHARYSEIEKLRVKHFHNFTQYGLYGIRIFFTPPAVSVFFGNPGAFQSPAAFMDSGEKLQFDTPVKGKALFQESTVGFMNPAGLLMLLGTLFSLYTGYALFRNAHHVEYIRFLSSLSGFNRVAPWLSVAQGILLAIFFLVLAAAPLILLPLNGLTPGNGELFHYFTWTGLLILMQLIFYFAGMGCGAIRSRASGIIAVIGVWFFFVFLIPWVVRLTTALQASGITPAPLVELEKIRIIMNTEKILNSEFGVFISNGAPAPEPVRREMQNYLKFRVPLLQEAERRMIDEVETNVRADAGRGLFFPTTFYSQAGYAAAGKGYEHCIDFFNYCLGVKYGFQKYFIEKKFLTGYTEVTSFIRGRENIFHPRSRLPENFLWGSLLMALYVLVSYYTAMRGVRRRTFGVDKKEAPATADALEIEMKRGQTYVLITGGKFLKQYVLGFFAGWGKDFRGVVRLDDDDIGRRGLVEEYIYICRGTALPGDLQVRELAGVVKKLLRVTEKAAARFYLDLHPETSEESHMALLGKARRVELLLAAARLKAPSLIMMDDVLKGLTEPERTGIIERMRELKSEKTGILYFTDDVWLASRIGDSAGSLQALRRTAPETCRLV